MDNLSYRNNRPSTRASEPEQQAAATQPPQQNAPVQRAKRSHETEKKSKSPLKIAAVLAAVAVLVVAGWFFFMRTGVGSTIDSSKYQAVFFTNGQVYFGKLSPVNDEYMRLSNVYYLQTKSASGDDGKTSPQSASKQNNSDVELIKLGGEIHGPEDAMIISKDQVLFFENLKTDGNVSQTITNFQNKKAN